MVNLPDLRTVGDTFDLDDGVSVDVADLHGSGREYRAYAPRGHVWAGTENHVRVVLGSRELHRLLADGYEPCPDAGAGCNACDDE